MLKKIVASIIVLPLLIVPLFCCCIKQAQAAEVEHCHDSAGAQSATHDHADHKGSDSCDCHLFSTAVENTPAIQAASLSFPNVFPASDVVAVNSITYLKGSMHLAYLGPPIGVSSAVPLYTLYHSLRI